MISKILITLAVIVGCMWMLSARAKPVLKTIDEGDQLKQILNQTLVTTSLEVFKFYQGDYINP